jgi:hypothetical protein
VQSFHIGNIYRTITVVAEFQKYGAPVLNVVVSVYFHVHFIDPIISPAGLDIKCVACNSSLYV